jgi:clan AA aspartic protease
MIVHTMGLISTSISLSNPRDPILKAIEVEALVDTGATTPCIPEHVAVQLQLPAIEQREVVTAGGKSHLVSYVGPIQVKFENRTCFTGAPVLGDSVLMGAVPMEDMDLVVHPREQKVTVNPKSPNIPSAIVK